ncbi:MAG: hypothetical protein AAF719_09625 [Pseudomonadota bacterium]
MPLFFAADDERQNHPLGRLRDLSRIAGFKDQVIFNIPTDRRWRPFKRIGLKILYRSRITRDWVNMNKICAKTATSTPARGQFIAD